MPRIDKTSCEPFRAWNRLEPRTRKQDFDDVLKCAVHDPLWMLTRQWQFGEFQGEDTGSAIFAKIKIESTQISRYKSANEPNEVFTDSIPTETKVESEYPPLDYYCQVKAAAYFMKLLQRHFAGAAITNPFQRTAYTNKLKTLHPLVLPAAVTQADDHGQTVRKLQELVNEPLNSFLAANGRHWFDGAALYAAWTASVLSTVNSVVLFPDHTGPVEAALAEYGAWFKKPTGPTTTAAAGAPG